jgi:uncharacterized protein
MRNFIAVCVVVLVVGSAAFGEPELKGTPSELTAYLRSLPKSITLTGESKVKVQADKAIVEISIKTENSSLETCLKSNQVLRASITAKLGEAGIPADKIAAEKFSSTPRYGLWGDKPNKYEVRNLVKITVTDEKDFQQIAKIVDQHQEVEYQGLNFKHSNEKELKKQAIEQAFDDMLKKKASYESKLGITLSPQSFSEQLLLPQEQNLNKNYDGRSSKMQANISSYAPQQAAGEETVASPFGELAFTANVSGEFELKAKE